MQQEKVLFKAVLCFLVKESKVLLALKPDPPSEVRKIGAGCRNGYGGGINEGETPQTAAIRETREEIGVEVVRESLTKVAEIDFHNTKADDSTFVCKVHVYVATAWNGEPKSTDEMEDPQWFDKNELPIHEMMPADPHWLPIVLSGKKLTATFYYGPHQKELLGIGPMNFVESFPA